MRLIDVHKHVDNLETLNREAIINFNFNETPSKLNPHNFYSLSVHPQDIPINTNHVVNKVRCLLQQQHNIVAIGEVGLDKNVSTPLSQQVKLFTVLAHLSEEYKRPLIIHNIKATEQLIKIKRELNPKMSWIYHGFRGKKEMMEQLLSHNFYLSFGKYYNEESLIKMPFERMLIETDENKITVKEIIEKICKTKNIEEVKFVEQLTTNVEKVFFNS